MLADHLTDPTAIRNHLRELERDARRLIARAAYLEKLAQRGGADLLARRRLESQAKELREAAASAHAEISALCRQGMAA